MKLHEERKEEEKIRKDLVPQDDAENYIKQEKGYNLSIVRSAQ